MIFSFEVLPSDADLSSLRRAPDENSSMPLERCKAFVSGICGMSEFSYLLVVFGCQVTFASLVSSMMFLWTSAISDWWRDEERTILRHLSRA